MTWRDDALCAETDPDMSGIKVSNRDLVKAAGNAVTPPAARDLVAIAVESLGVAA